MKDDELIQAVRLRASNPATQTDYADRGCPMLPPPASIEDVRRSESVMGFRLHVLHQRLLTEVANGGFGPGDGLIGLPEGRLNDAGQSLIELRESLWTDPTTTGLPPGVVALCDWGDATWSCLDEVTDEVLTLDETGLVDTGMSLHEWLAVWVSGVSLCEKMFEFEEQSGINPFTRQPMTVRLRGRPLGTPYRGRVSTT